MNFGKKSVDHFNNIKKQKKFEKGTPYELKKAVYKWAAINNKGVTHYGCHPLLFKLKEAFPDMFHQDCAITKTLLGTVRDIYGGSRLSFQEAFNRELCKIWDEHHWTIWELNKPLSCFKGKDCRAFVTAIPKLCDWIEDSRLILLRNDRRWSAMVGALRTYKKLN